MYSLYAIFNQLNDYQESAGRYEELKNSVQKKQSDSPEINHEKLLKINEDYVGWLDISNTSISYPIVKGEDNKFYLKHNFFRERDFVGALFMDYQNSKVGLDKNTIIYGHNMKDKSMFGSLKSYLDEEFYKKHKYLTFTLPNNQTYKGLIFSVYSTRKVEWLQTDFREIADFASYLGSIKSQSVFPTQTGVGEEDFILTLSTCTDRGDDERIIVHAKLLNEGKRIEDESD